MAQASVSVRRSPGEGSDAAQHRSQACRAHSLLLVQVNARTVSLQYRSRLDGEEFLDYCRRRFGCSTVFQDIFNPRGRLNSVPTM